MKYITDNMILTKEEPTNAGSKMLENYTSLFDAEVISRLEKAGHSIIGKADCGEFGLDVLGETSFFKGESVPEKIKTCSADFALSVDNNGAPRRLAAISGLSYIKPSYGVISRYGIIPTACSSEGIGITSDNTAKIKDIMNIINGNDKKDGTTFPEEKFNFNISDIQGMKIAILKTYLEQAKEDVQQAVESFADKMKLAGCKVSEIPFDIAEETRAAWHIAFCAETCNNLSRYDGVKFGYRTQKYNSIEELYTGSRTEAFGLLTKSVILYGSDVLSKGRYENCYDKALRMRRITKQKLNELFKEFDILILPACTKLSYSITEPENSIDALYCEEYFSALASLTGIPCAVTGGIQILADTLNENALLSCMAKYEEANK